MDMIGAMRDTVDLMEKGLREMAEAGDAAGEEKLIYMKLPPTLQAGHIREMLQTMESGINPQDTERGFSEGKMGRWLGWAQAAVVAMGIATLEDMKELNKKWMD